MTIDAVSPPEEIWVIGVKEGKIDRGLWDRRRIDREPIKPHDLAERMATFVAGMQVIIDRVQAASDRWQLDEVTVSVEIGASGSINLLGTGAEVSSSGGLSLKFTRAAKAD
jgi:hypothetical protein